MLKRLGVRLQGLGLGFRAQQVEGLGLRSLGGDESQQKNRALDSCGFYEF